MTRICSPAPHEDGNPDQTDRPHLLAMQPEPIDTTFSYTLNAAGYSTSIARVWSDMADVERCHLCPLANCLARRDGMPRCHIGVPAFIEQADMELFDLGRWLVTNNVTLAAPATVGRAARGVGAWQGTTG